MMQALPSHHSSTILTGSVSADQVYPSPLCRFFVTIPVGDVSAAQIQAQEVLVPSREIAGRSYQYPAANVATVHAPVRYP